ncbi:MAG: response regulator transcription factor [Lachnospiraceae bacterium]
MYKILIIEDNPVIARSIETQVLAWGYEAQCVDDFQHVLNAFAAFDPQLVLLDISLPFYNGYHWCSEIRKVSNVPIIFISSSSDNMNIVMAMNMGGDDFIAKPFDMQVLTAKVQAVLRRTYELSGQSHLIEYQNILFNSADASLSYEGRKLSLSRNENRILQTLLENKGTIVSREYLMERLWESDNYIDENTLTVNMTRLRRKLEEHGITDLITTKKGSGYLLG